MQFPTLIFAVFFTCVLTLSWWTRRYRPLQKLTLTLASFVFYGAFNWKLAALLLLSTLINYAAGAGIAAAPARRGKRLWLGLSLLLNLGLLAVFKYFNFFSESLEAFTELLGLQAHIVVLELLLPAGISFYTFQGLAYCIDLYRGVGLQARSLLDFALFHSFFPKLMSGPIVRSRDFLPQLEGAAPGAVPDLSRAASLILSGLVKKAVLATLIDTHLVNAAFGAPEHYSSPALWVAMFAYSLQIYWDFSGYTDLALGLALLLGFHLPENFNHPYVATNIGDYWKRWHITFSQWLRDYIYLPLGGSRRPPLRRYFNLFLTMLVCGIWHGAHWKYVLWGVVHGLALVGFKIGRDLKQARGGDMQALDPRWRLVLGWLWTFFICSFSRVFFNSASFASAWLFLSRMFNPGSRGAGFELLILALVALGLALQFYGAQVRGWFIAASERLPFAMRPVAWFAAGVIIMALKPAGIAPYIYFGF